ncbi:ATP-dependent RecD-like DNA helicase [Cloacibacillus sp. An23]|uniref:SF1B family DNA helicase RecD2 n=1 Tax=Cloacibacillus sp. An23 TaxID=1965591 RepID=UPI00194DC4A9|nr:ATP-dependent RecD-like DNA helicase [Cloacibacillus sp. An23]
MNGEDSQKTIKSPALTIDLHGQAEHIVYRNAENGYTVLRLRVRGYPDLVTAVGILAEPAVGEILTMKGRWTENSRYGMQFHFDECDSAMPSTADGLEKFLGSGLIRGIGPATAGKIVEKFGADTARILDEEPMRLAEVKGVSLAKAEAAGQSWREQREVREVMIFLQGHGVGAGYVMRIFRKYGLASIDVMKANPYQIALEVPGIGFATADAIAQKLGVPHDSPYRIAAGVHSVLNDLTGEGHVYVPRRVLASLAAEKLGVAEETAAEGIEQARMGGNVVVEGISEKEGEEESAVYLPAFHYAETHSAKNLRMIADEPYNSKSVDCAAALPWLEREMGITFAEAQREAITRAVNSKVMVITGGPGTGKTTIIRAVLRLREEGGYRVMLAAPTGRAAKRMTEATGHEARTIHRLLEYSSGGSFGEDQAQRAASSFGGCFMRNEENKLECDLLIVDEASMIDQILFHHLLKAVPRGASLIFVGDVNQLPSVSPGNVLKDVIDSGVCPVVMLNEIFRQSGESRIITNAHRVNRGEMPLEPEDGALSDFYFIEPKVAAEGLSDEEYKKRFDERVLATIKKLVTESIPRRFKFDPVNEIQVLCPMHSGVAGTRRLNAELEKLLNTGGGARVQRLDRVFRAGDKVMQIKNNYDKDVYNGDIGTILSIDGENSRITVKMDAGVVEYDFTELDELVHAYAVSIHKSQGSEYPAVVIPLLTQHYVMLQRNLLYTAITRGKKLVVIVGTKKALRIAVANDRTKKRYTRLAQRLRGER